MSLEGVLSWMVCGLIVGMVARYLMPGPQTMGLPLTIVLGIAGAFVGGAAFSLIQGVNILPVPLVETNVTGWVVAVLGAMLVLFVYPYISPPSWGR